MPEKDKNKSQQNGTEQQKQSYSSNIPKSGDKLAAGIGGATSILDSTIDLAQTNDGYEDEIARIRNQAFSPSGTYSLMEQYNNMYWGVPKTLYDFTGKTSGDYAKGILGTTATGALAGTQIMPGIGTAFGALLGLGAGFIGMGANQIKGNQEYKAYQKERADAIDLTLGNFDATNNAYKQNQFSNAMKSFYRSAEYGGLLGTHGSDFSNDIKYINVGGTHEQNPNNGVLMGIDEEGTPNLVEEGEVIFNDYVFSARLKPSKKALNDSLIGDKYFGMTYAEIAEKLAEKSEEMPNDKIEQNTLNANFKRLITIQEEQRARNEQREANMFEGGGPMTQNEYNNRISEFKRKAHRYASKYADNGTANYQKLYDAKFTELSEETEKEWAKVKSEQESSQEKLRKENERLNAIASYMEKNGFKVPKIFDSLSKQQKVNYSKLEEYYNELVNSGVLKPMAGGNDEVSAMEAELEKNYPIPDDTQQEQQVVQQAAQTAEETVAKSDPSGATSSSNAASTSSGAAGSGTRTPIRDGNIVKPDLTNARVGNGQIQYDRNQNGEEFENQQYYQDFLKYMDSIKDTPEAQEWIDAINAGSFGDMNGYKIKDYKNWYDLATDKKVGPVHTATLMAAQNWGDTEMARRAMNRDLMTPIATGDPYLNGAFKVQTPKEDIIRESSLASDNENPINEEPKDYSYLLRYAPILGNALALLGNRKDYSDVHRFEGMTANPRTVRFSPIGTYIRPNLVAPSEMSTPIENQMAGERNYISNNSLGNSTASNNYMLASDYLGNSRIGAAYLQGKQYNAEQRQKAAAYNLGIDQYNSEGSFKEQQQNMALNNYYLQRAIYDYNMRNGIDTAYNQARSSNLTALFNNLGNIGLDTFNARRANAASPLYNQLSSGEIEYLRKMMEENS